MPFAPIDKDIKDETIKLVQQNKSLTQIHNELHKQGRNVSRSWVANIARKYKKSIVAKTLSVPPVSNNKSLEVRRLGLDQESLLNQKAQELESLSQSLNQQAAQQHQFSTELAKREAQLQQQITDYNKEKERQTIEAEVQSKAHQRKEAFLTRALKIC